MNQTRHASVYAISYAIQRLPRGAGRAVSLLLAGAEMLLSDADSCCFADRDVERTLDGFGGFGSAGRPPGRM